jgi:hypothetical protein
MTDQSPLVPVMSGEDAPVQDPKALVAEWRARLAAGEIIPDSELAQALALIRRSRLIPATKVKAEKSPKTTSVRTADELKSLFTQKLPGVSK